MSDNVILYSTGCPRCMVLKKKLASKGIQYIECNDVDTMTELGIQAVPVLSIDGKMKNFTEAVAWINMIEGE